MNLRLVETKQTGQLELTLIGRHWTGLRRFLGAARVTGIRALLTHCALSLRANHQRRAVVALDGRGEGAHREVMASRLRPAGAGRHRLRLRADWRRRRRSQSRLLRIMGNGR